MFKTKTKIDANVQLELTKSSKITSIVMLVIGILGLLVYIVVGTIWENLIWTEYFISFAIPFAVGLVMIIGINKANNRILNSNTVNENEFEFHEKYVEIVTYRNEENVGNTKLFYSDIFKVRETKNYIFLYLNAASALPINKNNLDQNQLIILRGLLKLPLNK